MEGNRVGMTDLAGFFAPFGISLLGMRVPPGINTGPFYRDVCFQEAAKLAAMTDMGA
jgi:hypothetical protein